MTHYIARVERIQSVMGYWHALLVTGLSAQEGSSEPRIQAPLLRAEGQPPVVVCEVSRSQPVKYRSIRSGTVL